MTSPSRAGLGDDAKTGVPAAVDMPVPAKRDQKPEKVRSLTGDALHDLIRRPLFIVSALLIVLFVLMAAVPQLFTNIDPNHGELSLSQLPPSGKHWFGTNQLGQDVYARAIYGARASIVVGFLAALGSSLLGLVIGVLGGYFGGWIDVLLARVTDIFFGLPFLIGAIVILVSLSGQDDGPIKITGLVVIALVVLAWTQPARILRSAVISTKTADYVAAARSLGAGPWRLITKHILPNAISPLIVYSTVSLGAFIGAEATLSYLGIGLHYPVVSWGVDISGAQDDLAYAPWELLFPAGFLVVAVLAFVMLGDAVREALDPKLN